MARTPSGKYLIADLNDNVGAYVSASKPEQEFSSTNENLTKYSLFPYDLNGVPIFTETIFDSSEPKMVSNKAYFPGVDADVMYYDDSNIVRVAAGSSFTLKVSAQQPDILNVENGIPVIKPLDREIRYEWLVDGNLVFDVEPSFLEVRPDKRKANNNVLEFINVTKRMQGTYTCVVTNDIGQVTSEEVTIEIMEPIRTDDPFNAFFRKNAIQNGFATDGTNSWTAIIGEVAAKPMLTKEQEAKAKLPNVPIFGHAAGEIYPHPFNIRANSIAGYKPASLMKNGYYFTRGPLQYTAAGGTTQTAFYQDVDLSEITDYISGRVYGCKGVRAYFGCIIGNAITRFLPTVDVLGPDERNKPEFYFSDAPRISYENFSLAGPGLLEEMVTVIVQEYENATPLQSTIYEDGEEKVVDNIEFTDTLSTLLKQQDQFNEPVLPPFPTVTVSNNRVVTLPQMNSSIYKRLINLYKTLYPNKEEYFSQGQYAEHRDVVFSKLNPRTNKIRVTINFNFDSVRNIEIDPSIISNDMFDLEIWRKPYLKLILGEYNRTVLQIFQQNQSSQYRDRARNEQIKSGNTSRGMVTGMGLVLEAIMPTSNDISGFKRGVVDVIPKELEQRPNPTNVYTAEVSFEEAAKSIEGVEQLLDTYGDVGIRFYRKYQNAKWHGFAGTGTPKHEADVVNGRLIITDLTDNQILFDTNVRWGQNSDGVYGTVSFGEGASDPTNIQYLNFLGEHMIRISVEALPDGSDWTKKAYPYLCIQTINESQYYTGEIGASDIAPLYPIYNSSGDAIQVGESLPLQQCKWFNADSYYQLWGGNDPGSRYSFRTTEVDIPSNLIRGIYAGVKYNDGSGANDVSGVYRAEIQIQPQGLTYVRKQ